MVITAHYFLVAFDYRKEKIIIKKIKDFDNEILSIYKNFDFKYLYNREPQILLRF